MTAVRSEQVRSALQELADEPCQRRLWTGRVAGEMSSFVECVSRLYDDSGLDFAFERDERVFGPPVDDDLRALARLVSRVNADQHPDDLIDDPAMERVRKSAGAILLALATRDADSR